jgi:hypothetical protein
LFRKLLVFSLGSSQSQDCWQEIWRSDQDGERFPQEILLTKPFHHPGIHQSNRIAMGDRKQAAEVTQQDLP